MPHMGPQQEAEHKPRAEHFRTPALLLPHFLQSTTEASYVISELLVFY